MIAEASHRIASARTLNKDFKFWRLTFVHTATEILYWPAVSNNPVSFFMSVKLRFFVWLFKGVMSSLWLRVWRFCVQLRLMALIISTKYLAIPKLYLYSPSGPSWPVLGRPLPLRLHNVYRTLTADVPFPSSGFLFFSKLASPYWIYLIWGINT